MTTTPACRLPEVMSGEETVIVEPEVCESPATEGQSPALSPTFQEVDYSVEVMPPQTMPEISGHPLPPDHPMMQDKTEVLELPPKHNQIARLVALGFSNVEISKKIDMHPNRISEIKRSPLFKAVVAGIKKDLDECTKKAQSLLVEAAPEAAETLIDLLHSENEQTRRYAAGDILKGTGAVIRETREAGVNIHITENKLDLIVATLREMK